MDARLLNSQNVDVFEAVKSRGLDPLMFCWADAKWGNNAISVLQFGDEHLFYFQFGYSDPSHHAPYRGRYVPGNKTREESFATTSWPNVLHLVKIWIDCVQREISTPDPWKSFAGICRCTAVTRLTSGCKHAIQLCRNPASGERT